MKSKVVSLSIAIPTFQRKNALSCTLRSINSAAAAINLLSISVHVSDNDPNGKGLEEESALYPHITVSYSKNSFNLGAGHNIIASCLNSASNYVWPIGDDTEVDYLSIFRILESLLQLETQMVFITSDYKFYESLRSQSGLFSTQFSQTFDESQNQDIQVVFPLSSSQYLGYPARGEEGFLGRYIYLNDQNFRYHLSKAKLLSDYAHPYLYISYSILLNDDFIGAEKLAIAYSRAFLSGTDPDLSQVNYRVLPRWSVGDAHFGAFKTSMAAAISYDKSLRHANAILLRARETMYHMPIICNAILRDILGLSPISLSHSDVIWLVKTATTLRGKAYALTAYLLFINRNNQLVSFFLFFVMWKLSPRFQAIFCFYSFNLGLVDSINSRIKMRQALTIVTSRSKRFTPMLKARRDTLVY